MEGGCLCHLSLLVVRFAHMTPQLHNLIQASLLRLQLRRQILLSLHPIF